MAYKMEVKIKKLWTMSFWVLDACNKASGMVRPKIIVGKYILLGKPTARIIQSKAIIENKKNVNSIDLFEQSSGIYFVTLIDDKGQVMQRSKIVKE